MGFAAVQLMNGFFGYLLRTWFGRMRAILFGLVFLSIVIETFLFIFFFGVSWLNSRELERLTTEGVQVEATIENVDVYFVYLGVKIVKLDLAWTDAAGTTRRQTVTPSDEIAARVVSGRRAIRPTLPVKYLSGERDATVLLLNDASRKNEVNSFYMRAGAVGLGLCALGLAILYVVRRHIRRKYPELPASFTSWPKYRDQFRRTNSFFRIFMQYKYVTVPLLVGLTYALKYTGLFEIIESLTGLSEYWTWVVLTCACILILGISGWCYDRYGEWRSQTRPQDPTPSVTS